MLNCGHAFFFCKDWGHLDPTRSSGLFTEGVRLLRALKFQNISTRLILIGLVLVGLATAGRIFFLGDYLRDDISVQARSQLVVLANHVARDVDDKLVTRREYLQRLASRFPAELLSDRPRLGAWLREQQYLGGLFSQGLLVVDAQGRALSHLPDLAPRVGVDLATRDFFQQAFKGEFAVGRPFMGLASQVPVLPMALSWRNEAGQLVAVLVGVSALNSPHFLDTLSSVYVGATAGLLLVSPRDQIFVGASHGDYALEPTPVQGLYPLFDQAVQGFRGSGVGSHDGDVEEFLAFASVPASGWFVLAHLPTAEAFAPVTNLQRFMMGNALFLMVFISVLMVTVLRYLLRPLRHAADHADRMTRGELPLEPLPVVRDDEVGHMTMAFNRVLSTLIHSRRELEHLAHHDRLTGLPNRQLLAELMQAAFDRAQRHQRKVVVLYLDLDGFKAINDRLGHDTGDAALCEVTRRLTQVLRRVDTLARVGGDEFVLLLSDLDDNANVVAELVAGKCLQVFNTPVVVAGQTCALGVSIGLVMGDGDSSAEEMLNAADQAMYRAKQAGRGRFDWAGAGKSSGSIA